MLATDPETNAAVANADIHPLRASNICSLMDSPDLYHGREIIVKTTLVRIGSEYWLGDEGCPSRHPLFDVEFENGFHALICEDTVHFSRGLCDIVTPEKNDIDLTVTAVFTGRFEYERATDGFTYHGMRFRLLIKDVASISEIKNIKRSRPK